MDLYLIRNMATGMAYVGTTVNYSRRRFREHLSAARRNQAGPLYEAMRKHGTTAFVCLTLGRYGDYEALLQAERDEIARRQTLWPGGYNKVKGGRGNLGWTPSSEVRAKISARTTGRKAPNKGVPMSAGQRQRCAESQRIRAQREIAAGVRVNPFKGRVHTAEWKRSKSAESKQRWDALTSDQQLAHINMMNAARAKNSPAREETI